MIYGEVVIWSRLFTQISMIHFYGTIAIPPNHHSIHGVPMIPSISPIHLTSLWNLWNPHCCWLNPIWSHGISPFFFWITVPFRFQNTASRPPRNWWDPNPPHECVPSCPQSSHTAPGALQSHAKTIVQSVQSMDNPWNTWDHVPAMQGDLSPNIWLCNSSWWERRCATVQHMID